MRAVESLPITRTPQVNVKDLEAWVKNPANFTNLFTNMGRYRFRLCSNNAASLRIAEAAAAAGLAADAQRRERRRHVGSAAGHRDDESEAAAEVPFTSGHDQLQHVHAASAQPVKKEEGIPKKEAVKSLSDQVNVVKLSAIDLEAATKETTELPQLLPFFPVPLRSTAALESASASASPPSRLTAHQLEEVLSDQYRFKYYRVLQEKIQNSGTSKINLLNVSIFPAGETLSLTVSKQERTKADAQVS